MRVFKDIAYKSNEDCKLDLYLPDKENWAILKNAQIIDVKKIFENRKNSRYHLEYLWRK